MNPPVLFPVLGFTGSVRPVFLVIMGIALMIIAFRLTRSSGKWSSRFIIAGGILLGFGYAVILPLQEAGKIPKFSPTRSTGSSGTALAWYAVQTFTLNIGWLVLGVGLAIRTRLFQRRRHDSRSKPPASAHEPTS